LPLPPSHVTWL